MLRFDSGLMNEGEAGNRRVEVGPGHMVVKRSLENADA